MSETNSRTPSGEVRPERDLRYFYERLCRDDLEVVRPLITRRGESYALPPHVPGLQYLVGIYGLDPMPGDYSLKLARVLDDEHSATVRAATPREILQYLRRKPTLPSPAGWGGEPGQLYAVLQFWLEILDEKPFEMVS